VGEAPGSTAMAGGALIVGALVVNGLAALRGERAGALSSSPQN